MNKVLITGATGFLGRYCLPFLLQRGFEVHAISRQPQSVLADRIHWHQSDLSNPDDVSELFNRIQPSHCLHLAWLPFSEINNIDSHKKWISIGLHLLHSFAQAGGTRMVAAGCAEEYGYQSITCSESFTQPSPSTAQADAKRKLQIHYDNLSTKLGVSTAWARLFQLFGPFEHPARFVPQTIFHLIDDQHPDQLATEDERDFIYVKEAALALVKLLESHLTGPINIATGIKMSKWAFALKLAQLLDKEECLSAPEALDENMHLTAEIHRLIYELKWTPEYTLESAMEETIAFWQQFFSEDE